MTVFRYVDTAASPGGDGTSRDHSGGTHAYDSLATAESDIDFDYADLNAVGDDLTVKCAGSAVDDTAEFWNALGTNATYTLTVMGDDGANDSGGDDGAGFDDDGRYTGPLDWSTDHYRIDQSATAYTLQLRQPMTLDGIQAGSGLVGVSAAIRAYNAITGGPTYTIQNCRVWASADDGNNRAINLANGTEDSTCEVINCFAGKAGAGYGFDNLTTNGVTNNYTIRNCTIVGSGSGVGIRLYEYGATSAGALDIRNTVIGGFSDDYTRGGTTGLSTEAGGYNWSDDNDVAGGPNTGDGTLGTHVDEWVDPTGTSPGDFDFAPKRGGNLAGAGDSAYAPALDINGNVRNVTSPSVGAFEFVGSLFRAGIQKLNGLGTSGHFHKNPLG